MALLSSCHVRGDGGVVEVMLEAAGVWLRSFSYGGRVVKVMVVAVMVWLRVLPPPYISFT